MKASKYLTNKHGVLKDVLLTFKSLPTLNYHLSWSSFDNVKQIKKYEKMIYAFLEDIVVKEFVRDGLYETAELGTIITCLRKSSTKNYIQFLDINCVRVKSQVDGKWVVEYDLSTIKGTSAIDIVNQINSLPSEITITSYNQYKNKGEDFRFVSLNNCDVIKANGNRNHPYGLPITLGAWASLIQKEIINRVERSVSDRLIKQVLILYAGSIGGKDSGKPAPKPLIEHYFSQVSDLMQKKEMRTSNTNTDNEISGTGVIALPDFFTLDALKVDVTMFTKDLYQKINNDIFMNLGVSEALVYGSGANYSSAQVNSDKFMRYIFTVIESFENIINNYIKDIIPSSLQCKFYFDRTTMLDKDKFITQCKELYMQTGIVAPWIESLLGIPYQYILGQAMFEKEVLRTQDYLYPPLNANTMSSDQGGRPEDGGGGERTNKSKSSGGNLSPSPSD